MVTLTRMRGGSGSSLSLKTDPDFGCKFWKILLGIWSFSELSQFVSFCWDGIKIQAVLKRKTSKIQLPWNILKLDEIKCCFKIPLLRKLQGKTPGETDVQIFQLLINLFVTTGQNFRTSVQV